MPTSRYEPDPERDDLAQTLAWSFYRRGHIYEASLEKVVRVRWAEWREQAEDLLAAYPALRQAVADKALYQPPKPQLT